MTDLKLGADPDLMFPKGKRRRFNRNRKAKRLSCFHKRVLSADDHRCVKCGSNDLMTGHHIIYRSQGGHNTIDNGITLCSECHHKAHHGYTDGVRITGREFMITLLESKQHDPDFRWSSVLEYLRRKRAA